MEVWRGTDSSDGEGAARSDTYLSSSDGDAQERKLDCVVRRSTFSFKKAVNPG